MEWKNLKQLIELREEVKSFYDNDTQYIENYKQMLQAQKCNVRIQAQSDFLKNIIEEFQEIESKIPDRKVRKTLRYLKGHYMIEIDGKKYYKKTIVDFRRNYE